MNDLLLTVGSDTLSDRKALYELWLRAHGYPREVSLEQRQAHFKSQTHEDCALLDLLVLEAPLFGVAVWLLVTYWEQIKALTMLFMCMGGPLMLIAFPAIVVRLAAFIYELWEVTRKSVTGPFTWIAFSIRLRQLRRENIPPAADSLDFDSIDVLEPIASYLARPILSNGDQALGRLARELGEVRAERKRVEEVAARLMREVEAASDPDWRNLLLGKLEPLDLQLKQIASRIESMEAAHRFGSTEVDRVRKSLNRLRRYRDLLNDVDQLVADSAPSQVGGTLEGCEALSRLQTELSSLANTLKEIDVMTVSYGNAKLELMDLVGKEELNK